MSTSKFPQLPPTTDADAHSLRYEVNPAIALNALTDAYQRVQQYQIQLRRLAGKIHQVYAEGPVVSGWLASEASLTAAFKQSNQPIQPSQSNPINRLPVSNNGSPSSEPQPQVAPTFGATEMALFRHGDANDLMNYLSALESSMLGAQSTAAAAAADFDKLQDGDQKLDASRYYLCQLDSSGQIQAEPCPAEQVPVLSMAIARYRRLNQLITQKQAIESKLQSVVDILSEVKTVLAAP